MPDHYLIRRARPSDIETIVTFTVREAREAEQTELDSESVLRGVRGGFDEPPLSVYWVVETSPGDVIASTSVVREWSNFNGGWYWWVQSLFVVPEHRGHGLVDRLLEHLAHEAASAGALDLRLYAHASNTRAGRAYARCGFQRAPYVMMTRALR